MTECNKRIRQLVLLKFKENTPAETIKEFESELPAMKGVHIPEVKSFVWGSIGCHGHSLMGFTHAMVFTFDDEAGVKAYMENEDHAAFRSKYQPHMDKVEVCSFSPKCCDKS